MTLLQLLLRRRLQLRRPLMTRPRTGERLMMAVCLFLQSELRIILELKARLLSVTLAPRH